MTETHGGHVYEWRITASPSGISETVVYVIDGRRVSGAKFYDRLAVDIDVRRLRQIVGR
jgi:hypothetical protein